MKKNIVSAILLGTLLFSLCACGTGETTQSSALAAQAQAQAEAAGVSAKDAVETDAGVSATDADEAETADATEAVLADTEEEMTQEAEAEEVEEEVVEEEEIDTTPYFEKQGLTISSPGEITYTSYDMDTSSITCTVQEKITVSTAASSQDGYSDTTATITYISCSLGDEAYYWSWYSLYDYYTGICLESENNTLETGDTLSQSALVTLLDGTEYVVSFSTELYTDDDGNPITVITVHHPSDYDGVVFSLGGYDGYGDVAEYAAQDPAIDRKFFRG